MYYEKIKGDFPTKMKLLTIVAIAHKSKAFGSILYLSFSLKLTPHGSVSSVKKYIQKTALGGKIDQIRHVLLRLIPAFAESPDCAKIFQSKWDINDGFWRIDCKEVEENNLFYVLPQKPGMTINLVVPTLLHMG